MMHGQKNINAMQNKYITTRTSN